MKKTVNRAKRFDFSKPFLLPVTFEEKGPQLYQLSAMGEAVTFHGELFQARANRPVFPRLDRDEREFITLSLKLGSKEASFLKSLTWFAGEWRGHDEQQVHSTRLIDNALFLRKSGVSFFISLDFPYSKITSSGISYPAQEKLKAGCEHECHSISLAACALSGIKVGDFDRAEIEAFSRYIETRFPPRFERPIVLTEIIANRMTECGPTGVFYSMYDNPTIHLDPELLKQDIKLYADIGVEFCQVFENQFDWPDKEKDGRNLADIVAFSNALGIRIGSWISPHGLHCSGFFDYDGSDDYNFLERRAKDSSGRPGAYCLGCEEHLRHLLDQCLSFARKYNEEIMDFDFLNIMPCHNPAHQHAPGDIYRQILGIVKLARALGEVSPHYLVWSNLGWSELAPKIAWVNPSMYLTDPHVARDLHGLNKHKIAGDTRRHQMVGAHNKYFLPYRFFTNYEYYLFPRNRISMRHVFEYSFLQGLAVTPNIGIGELRTYLNSVPHDRYEYCLAFIRKWLDFIKANYRYWKQTWQVENKDENSPIEIYAHTLVDSGYICLVNQSHYKAIAAFSLDGSIGLERKTRYELFEVYPREQMIPEQSLPANNYGDTIHCQVQPYGVRYIRVSPEVSSNKIKVYGPCRAVEKTSDGYKLILTALQGTTQRVGLVLPGNESLDSIIVCQAPTVKRFTFPVSASIVDQSANLAWLNVKFPRQPAPDEIRHWRLNGKRNIILPAHNCEFLGALVSGTFSENYTVELEVRTAPPAAGRTNLEPIAAQPVPYDNITNFKTGVKYTFITGFHLPFIEESRFSRNYGDDAVIYLPFTNTGNIKEIKAYLNGKEVDIGKYPVESERYLFIELAENVNGGTVSLKVEVEWARFTPSV